jgi:hypothetical protein
METFTKLEAALAEARPLVEKVGKGNKSAGTKLRKAMQEVRNLAKAVRDDVLERRNAAPAADGEAQ